MSCTRIFKKILLSTTAFAMLTGCAVLDKKNNDKESCWLVRQFEKDGNKDATKATMAYSQGEFKKALEFSMDSLKANPRNQQALLVGALAAEKEGRYNRARQNYEDLIVIDSKETSVLGSTNGEPQSFRDIAKSRLRNLMIKQTDLIIEAPNGNKSFNIKPEAGNAQSTATIKQALSKKKPAVAKKASSVGNLFSQQEQNVISRFLVLKELAEKDYITKEEFLTRRIANIGGLLPLTNTPPAVGIDQPVPAPELIVERITILKEGVADRAITPREFSAERDVIVEALMTPNPRARLKPKAPSKDIFGAARDLRKLEVLYDLNLITAKEKEAEKKEIEKYLGINHSPRTSVSSQASQLQVAPVGTTPQVAPVLPSPAVQTKTEIQAQEQAPNAVAAPVIPVQENTDVVEVKTTVKEVPIPVSPEVNTVTKNGDAVALIAKTEVTAPVSTTETPNVSSPF